MATFPSQRAYMQSLVQELGLDESKVISAYAAAEREHLVSRKSNPYDYTPEQYAKQLWRDGIRKGWLTELGPSSGPRVERTIRVQLQTPNYLGPVLKVKAPTKGKHAPFQMPAPVSIMGRTSSITNSFINAIIPVIPPSIEEVDEALAILGMDASKPHCAYCGDPPTEWDHLRPLVVDQRPTGFISEITNLVPSCGKCNQSKGNKPWREWIRSSAKLSPATRRCVGLDQRIERLTEFERWKHVTPIDIEQIVGREVWAQHWSNWKLVIDTMKMSQSFAVSLRTLIAAAHETER